jgi:hypothetical protein
MEYDDAAGPKAPGEPAQHVGGVGLKQQYVPTDDRIEGLPEAHLGRFALASRHDRSGRSVNADDRALVTGQIGSQKRDVATTAAYVKDSHSGDDPRIDEELSGDRFNEPGLPAQTLEFAI